MYHNFIDITALCILINEKIISYYENMKHQKLTPVYYDVTVPISQSFFNRPMIQTISNNLILYKRVFNHYVSLYLSVHYIYELIINI